MENEVKNSNQIVLTAQDSSDLIARSPMELSIFFGYPTTISSTSYCCANASILA